MKDIIHLRLATKRDDGGKTKNYRVYEGGGTVTAKNEKGETVTKNAILGGNGTIYIANELAGEADELVLVSRKLFDELRAAFVNKKVTAKPQPVVTAQPLRQKGGRR